MKFLPKLLGRLILLAILFSIGLTVFSLLSDEKQLLTDIRGGYGLIKEGSRSAYIAHQDSPDTPIIDSIVISYATSNDIIAVKQTAVPEETAKPDFTTFVYWLLDTKTGRTYGPLADDTALAEQSTALGVTEFGDWLGT